jgi:hypothetical protein
MGKWAGIARRKVATAALAACALASFSACAGAQDSDSTLKSAAKALGFATDVGPPADFVTATRPKGELDYIPIFTPPGEPPTPALDEKAQKAIAADLEATNRRAEAMRGAFTPAAKPKSGVKKPVKKPLIDGKTPANGAD